MFKFLLLAVILVSTVFSKISGKGCTVYYSGFGEGDLPAADKAKNICDPATSSCVTVNGTIHEKAFQASDCENTLALILTRYLQGQQAYTKEISFDCSGMKPSISYNDDIVAYSYQCSERDQDIPSTTNIPTTTNDASTTISSILSSIILSAVYIAFN